MLPSPDPGSSSPALNGVMFVSEELGSAVTIGGESTVVSIIVERTNTRNMRAKIFLFNHITR